MGLSKLAKGWRKGAIKGNAEDQYQLAECYQGGREGVKRDKMAAAAWYGKAAEQQHADAQREFGSCYVHGDGVEQSLEVAAQWSLRAAALGDAEAQGLLGYCYANGSGVEQDDAQAVTWWEKAAKGGNVDSQYTLGRGYMDGSFGLPKYAQSAKVFMMAAAEQGHEDAIRCLKLLRACTSCGAPDATRTCLGCRSCTGLSVAGYCTPACQEKDGKFHKLDCGGSKACECGSCVGERGESSTAAAPE